MNDPLVEELKIRDERLLADDKDLDTLPQQLYTLSTLIVLLKRSST